MVSWNAKVSRDPQQVMSGLRDIVGDLDPDVVCLQEFKGYMKALRDTFGGDWFIYAHADWDESNDNPLMVRRAGHEQLERGVKNGWDTLRTRTDWTGPHGNVHHGRTWTWAKVSGVWVMSFHRVTGGNGKNRAAFAEEHDAVVTWLGNHQPAVVIGDHNCGPHVTTYPNTSRLIADHAGGGIDHHGGIDYAIVVDANGEVTWHGKHGSDHPAIRWKAT